MTVKELIELLSNEDEQAEVFFVCSYGDRGQTQQALSVDKVSVEHLRKSAYSNSGLAVLEDLEDEEDITDRVVVLS